MNSAPLNEEPGESIGRLAARAAAEESVGCVSRLTRWLLPVVVLGGLGLYLFNAGSTETSDGFGGTNIALSSSGFVGVALICFAVAAYFGRGVIATFTRVFRGEGTFLDLVFSRTSVVSAFIATGAIIAGFACLFWAATQ